MANQANETREKNQTDFETPFEDNNDRPLPKTTSESFLLPAWLLCLPPQTNIDELLGQLNCRDGRFLFQQMLGSDEAYKQPRKNKEQDMDLHIHCEFFPRLRYIKIRTDILTWREGQYSVIRTIAGISKMCPRPLIHGAYAKVVLNDTSADFMIIEKRCMEFPVASEREVQNFMQPPAKINRRLFYSAGKENHKAAILFSTKNTHVLANDFLDSNSSSGLPVQQSQRDAATIHALDLLSQLTGNHVDFASSLTFLPDILEFERLQKTIYLEQKESVRQWTRRIIWTSEVLPEPHRGRKTASHRTWISLSIHNIWLAHGAGRHHDPGSDRTIHHLSWRFGKRLISSSDHEKVISLRGVNKGVKDKHSTQHGFNPGSLHQDLAGDCPEGTAIAPPRGSTGCPSTPWTYIFRGLASTSQITHGYLPVRFLAFLAFVQGSNATSSSPLLPLSAYHLCGVIATSFTFFSTTIIVNSRLQRRTYQFQLGALALLLAFISSYTVDDSDGGHQLAYIHVFLALLGSFLLFRALFRFRSGCENCGNTGCNGNCGAGSSSGTKDYA